MEEEGEQHPVYSEFDFFVSNKEGWGATSSLILLFIWIFLSAIEEQGERHVSVRGWQAQEGAACWDYFFTFHSIFSLGTLGCGLMIVKEEVCFSFFQPLSSHFTRKFCWHMCNASFSSSPVDDLGLRF